MSVRASLLNPNPNLSISASCAVLGHFWFDESTFPYKTANSGSSDQKSRKAEVPERHPDRAVCDTRCGIEGHEMDHNTETVGEKPDAGLNQKLLQSHDGEKVVI